MMPQQNNPEEGESFFSEENLQRWGLVLLAVAVVFATIGAFVSPLDAQGKPVLLLPDVKAVEEYRRLAQSWRMELSMLDGEIGQVLDGQQGDLFTQSRSAQQTMQHAIDLAQQVERASVPPVAVGYHRQVVAASMAYLEAARAALQWVSAPQETNREAAVQKLEDARTLKSGLEENRWLTP